MPLADNWKEIMWFLADTTHKLTHEDILRNLTLLRDDAPPDRRTLLRWLDRATRQGLICRAGSGYRNDPFCYWLPGREPLLYPGDRASEAEKNAWRQRLAGHTEAQRQQQALQAVGGTL